MQPQQSTNWMVSLGVSLVTPKDIECSHRKAEIIQQLKADIIEKIDAGIAGEK